MTNVKRPRLRLEYRSPAELAENPRNWRTHPERQTAALAELVGEVGWAGACLFNERTGRLIDGHARRNLPAHLTDDGLIPVLIGSWSEAEEAKILATFDPVGGLAGTDPQALAALIASVDTECRAVADLIEGLAESGGAFADDAEQLADDAPPADSSEQSEKLREFIRRRQQSMERGEDKAEVNFWVCLVFASWDQKQEFLTQMPNVPVLYGMYADGEAFAGRVGMPVRPSPQQPVKSMLERKLAALVVRAADDTRGNREGVTDG
jgi:hypothetical protein